MNNSERERNWCNMTDFVGRMKALKPHDINKVCCLYLAPAWIGVGSASFVDSISFLWRWGWKGEPWSKWKKTEELKTNISEIQDRSIRKQWMECCKWSTALGSLKHQRRQHSWGWLLECSSLIDRALALNLDIGTSREGIWVTLPQGISSAGHFFGRFI